MKKEKRNELVYTREDMVGIISEQTSLSMSVVRAVIDELEMQIYDILSSSSESTDNVIKLINEKDEPVVFILWGRYARSKKKLITNPKHLIIESAHPSPLSAYNGFFGSKPFSKTNKYLESMGIKPINWEIK